MAQIYDIKKRMRSVHDIEQMTNAMHLVSAVKMKRARSQLSMTLPFFELCRATMAEIYLLNPELKHTFFNAHKKKPDESWIVGYFILTGDKGLAGAYNTNVLHAAENHIYQLMFEMAKSGIKIKPKLFVAGKLGKDYFRKLGFEIVEDFSYPIDSPTFYRARDISDYIHDIYDDKKIDSVYAVYTRINSVVDIKPVVVKLIPISPEDLLREVNLENRTKDAIETGNLNLEFVPSGVEVMDYLATTYLNGMVYGSLTEAFASEQTTRMSAMKNATDSAKDMLSDLSSRRNRARQSNITEEISEIVNGANSVT